MEWTTITEITLGRGPCLGTCPVFRFTATSQGRYSYEGRSHVEQLGPRSGRFPGYLFARLAEVCADLRVLELDDRYAFDIDDASYVYVEVRHAGGFKAVHSDGGDLGPVRLWAFAALIEVAMRQAFEIEDRGDPTRGKRGAERGPAAYRSVGRRAFDPTWRTGTVVALARQMVRSREFSAMPVLADALQDAGCNDSEILNHCRAPGPHVRDCWVLDLVLR